MMRQLERLYLRLYGQQTIMIVVNLGLLQFSLSRDEKEDIFEIGYNATNKFFHSKKMKSLCDEMKKNKS